MSDRLERDLADHRDEISRVTAAYSTGKRQAAAISWEEAVQRMLLEDLGLRQSAARVEDMRRQRERQWREWLPRPTLYASLRSGLRDIGTTSADDISLSFLAPLNLPNPGSQVARAYQYALQELQAEASHELYVRRQTVQLYRLFAQWERRERVAAREIGERGDFALAVENRLRGREREISNREAEQTQRTQLSRLLNLPGVDITPVAGSRPKLDYSSRLPSLIPGDNYGRLATRLSAYELEAALLRQRGLRFQRWPVPTFSAGTPAIYDSDRGSGGWIESADEISLFGSWGKSFDLTGREAATLRSAEEHVGFVRDNMRVRLDTEAAQWRRLQSRYRLVMERRALLAARVEAARRQGGGRASVQLEEFRRLSMELAEVEQRKEELDVEIWLWDDQAWK